MRRAIHVDSGEQTVRDLVTMLHQGAPADEFARRLADIDSLPPSYPGKSTLVETVRMAMAVRNRLELQVETPIGHQCVVVLGYSTVRVGEHVSLAAAPENVHFLPDEPAV